MAHLKKIEELSKSTSCFSASRREEREANELKRLKFNKQSSGSGSKLFLVVVSETLLLGRSLGPRWVRCPKQKLLRELSVWAFGWAFAPVVAVFAVEGVQVGGYVALADGLPFPWLAQRRRPRGDLQICFVGFGERWLRALNEEVT